MEILVHRRLEKYDISGCEVVDHKINACLRPATDKIFDDIGVNSSSHFRFRARTNRQTKSETQLQALATPRTSLSWVKNKLENELLSTEDRCYSNCIIIILTSPNP